MNDRIPVSGDALLVVDAQRFFPVAACGTAKQFRGGGAQPLYQSGFNRGSCAMQQIDLNMTLMAHLIDIARKASLSVMNIFNEMRNSRFNVNEALVTHKVDGSPLTHADLAAHQVITKCLADLTPDIPVVSEEDTHSHAFRRPEGDFWLIDPLDGTKEFLALSKEFTLNIALVRNGKPVMGVVMAPALDQIYWGGDGLGAFCEMNGRVQQIKVAYSVAHGQPIRVLASKSHINAETLDFISRLGPHQLVQAGSSLKFCLIAMGKGDVYPRLGLTCEWDTAAAQAIVEAAGGFVSSLDGSPLHYGKPDVHNPYFVASSIPLSELLVKR